MGAISSSAMMPAAANAASIDTLRAARLALAAAIRDGQTELVELRDLVEDELIEALARRRREAER